MVSPSPQIATQRVIYFLGGGQVWDVCVRARVQRTEERTHCRIWQLARLAARSVLKGTLQPLQTSAQPPRPPKVCGIFTLSKNWLIQMNELQ